MNNIIKRKWNQNSMVIIEDLQGMAFQAESGGHTFQISGIDGEGNTVALSGTPAGVMLRADGQDVALTCSVSGGVVFATLPANAYSVPGRFGLTIFLTSDGQKTAIYAAVGTVGKTSSGTVAPPAGSDVVDLVNAIAAAVATIPASYTDLMAAVAPPYSSSGLYAVGNYAWYNGKLYRCTTPITSGETWTSGHWTLANLGSDLVDLKSAIDDITDAVIDTSETGITSTGTETGSIQTDGTINTSYTGSSALSFAVEPSTLYRFRGAFQWTMVGIAFYDSNNNFIEYKERNDPPQSSNTTFNAIYRTPANCTKVKVSKVGSYTCNVAQIVYTNNLSDDVTAINNTIGSATLKTKGDTLKAGINDDWDAVGYISDKIAFNEYLQNLFVLFRWNDTYGYVSNQTGMSIIAAQKFPYDVEITNLHYPDFIGAYVRTFSSILATPANLVDTIGYTFTGDDAVTSIILPKDTYWTVQFTRPGNVNIDLTTYKIIPNFIAGDNINFTSQLKINNTHVVGKKLAQYTKIQDAVDAASSGDTIYILPGTYEEAVSAWGKELHFVGFDRDSTIILEKSGLYSTPPLEVNIGSVRNLTLIETGEGSSWGDDGGKGRAYAVHIENGDGYTGVGELWFDNCKLINYAHAAVGCGLYQDLHVHFNNCYMYSGRADDVLDDYYRGTFYYHTCVAEDITGQQMTVKDCEIINEGTACFFGGVTPNATSATCRSTFINNNFFAMSAQTQNTNDIAIVYNILNFHDCKLNGNSRGNNIPALNAP